MYCPSCGFATVRKKAASTKTLTDLLFWDAVVLQHLDDNERVGGAVVVDHIDVGVKPKDRLEAVRKGVLVQLVGMLSHRVDQCAIHVCKQDATQVSNAHRTCHCACALVPTTYRKTPASAQELLLHSCCRLLFPTGCSPWSPWMGLLFEVGQLHVRALIRGVSWRACRRVVTIAGRSIPVCFTILFPHSE